MNKLLLALLVGKGLLLSSFANAAEKKLDVSHFWQDDGCWCGVATMEMVEQYYRGSEWPWYWDRQTNLAQPKNNGGVSVGTRAEADKHGPCGINGGVDTGEMLTMINYRLKDRTTGRWGDANLAVSGSPEQSVTFHKWAIEAIDKDDLYLFAGKTRYTDGTSTNRRSHWYLIIGYKDADGNSSTITEEDGYYIHDATVGANLSGVKTLGSVGKFVSHFDMMKHLANVNGYVHIIGKI